MRGFKVKFSIFYKTNEDTRLGYIKKINIESHVPGYSWVEIMRARNTILKLKLITRKLSKQ